MNPDKTFFTSDTHFGHEAMLRHGRRYSSTADMDGDLIYQWNLVVPPDGHVFHLGDVSFRSQAATLGILGELNGYKYLIEGNHDKAMNKLCRSMFEWVKPYHVFKMTLDDGRRIRAVLCHYAFRSWDMMHYGTWNIHGHSHGNLEPIGLQIDVGVDARHNNMAPVPLSYIVKYMDDRRIVAGDHHQPRK